MSTTVNSAGNLSTTGSPTKAGQNSDLNGPMLGILVTLLSVFCVTGAVGNALAIYVFASLKQKLTSTIFILTLAGTDFITCLITIPFTIYMESVGHYVNSDILCKIFIFLSTTTVAFSPAVMVAIAVDRYLCICHPFHNWMTPHRARIIIGVLAVVLSLLGGFICIHFTIYRPFTKEVPTNAHYTTAAPRVDFPERTNVDGYVSLEPDGHASFNVNQYSPEPHYYNTVDVDNSSRRNSSPTNTFSGKISTDACDLDWNLLDKTVIGVFRKIYSLTYGVSCIIVLILYSLIYRYVVTQRRKKLHIKSAQCCLLWNAASVETNDPSDTTQDIELSNANGTRYNARSNSTDEGDGHNNGAVRKCSLSKARIERMRVANIKTAFTLFIVTLVFIVAFLPAWLMALGVLKMHVIIFYMYFIYNVVNPFVYAFLNQNFKAQLRRILACRKQ